MPSGRPVHNLYQRAVLCRGGVESAGATRQQLRAMIAARSLVRAEESILLASGDRSDHYFDLKQVMGDPLGIGLLADMFYYRIQQIGGIRSVGGLESGSIPISTAVSQYSVSVGGTAVSSFYVRKKPKKHGLSKRIEGVLRSPAVLVDDVVTAGKSAHKALETLEKEGIKSTNLVVAVYRGTPEAKKRLEDENGIKIDCLFYESEILEVPQQVRPPPTSKL